MRLLLFAVAAALAWPAAASPHAPATAIGRAVEALSQVDVSYDPGAAVSDVEAAGFGALAGDGIAVAMLPASALSEITGGPQAVAAEVAREAQVDGTLVALVGTRLAAVSERVPRGRLDELARTAEGTQGTPAVRLEAFVRAVRAEQPTARAGAPWGVIAAVASVLLLAAAAVLVRIGMQERGAVQEPRTGQ
jgi:hypothetical protein